MYIHYNVWNWTEVRGGFKTSVFRQAVVAHTVNPITWEAEAGGSVSSKPA